MTRASKPANFRALVDAWDSPIAFATELSKYYSQLAEAGELMPSPDITGPVHGPGDA